MPLFTEHKPKVCALRIDDLSLQVQLGCTAEERAVPQEVRLSVEMKFAQIPQASFSDSLIETVCYAQISHVLKEHCETRSFQLIERIGAECFSLLKELTRKQSVEICLHVHKVRPPVQNLIGGSHFVCGDYLS